MATTVPFKASLYNPALILPASFDYILTPDLLNIVFNDYSNYDLTDEPGHLRADFTFYRKIIITHQSGAMYTMSSLGDGQQLISSGSFGSDTFNYPIQNKDGVYTFLLLTVPTWNPTANYIALIHNVWLDSTKTLYQALNNNVNSPPDLNPANWKAITQDKIAIKYQDVAYALITSDSYKCKCSLTRQAACLIKDNNCDDDLLCRNKCLLNALKVTILLESANESFANLDFGCTANDIDTIKQICGCDCGCKDCGGGC